MEKNKSEKKPSSILYIGVSADVINALTAYPQISFAHEKNALTATNYLKSSPTPDAILCELNVIGWNGFEIHDFLRSDQSFIFTPFILVSDEFREDIYKKAFKEEMDDYYVLPLTDIDGLVDRIRWLINYRKIEKKNSDLSNAFDQKTF